MLVAISIPIFTAQLEKSKLAAATANARSTYAEYAADCLSANPPVTGSITGLQAELDGLTANEKQGCTITAAANEITVTNSAGTNTIPTDIGS